MAYFEDHSCNCAVVAMPPCGHCENCKICNCSRCQDWHDTAHGEICPYIQYAEWSLDLKPVKQWSTQLSGATIADHVGELAAYVPRHLRIAVGGTPLFPVSALIKLGHPAELGIIDRLSATGSHALVRYGTALKLTDPEDLFV